jgi:hypothetical protein
VCKEAVKAKNLEVVKWAVDTGTLASNTAKISSLVAKFGTVEMAKYIQEKRFQFVDKFSALALERNNMEIFFWAKENNYSMDYCMRRAMALGNLEIVKMLSTESTTIVFSDLTAAVKKGQLEMLEYVFSNFQCPPEFPAVVIRAAAKFGSIKLVQMLREKGFPWATGACMDAALAGHFELLKYLRENNCPWDWSVPYHALCNNHIDIAKWAISSGCPFDESVIEIAVERGNLDFLNWLEQYKPDYSDVEIDCYFASGNLEVLKWIDEKGHFPSKDELLRNQAEFVKGGLECCKWAFAKWGILDSVLEYALYYGKADIAMWLISEYNISKGTFQKLFRPHNSAGILESGNLEFWKFLNERNLLPADAYYIFCNSWRHKHVLSWLLEIGRTFPKNCSDISSNMAMHELTSLCKWAIDNGCSFSMATMSNAILTENYELVEFLLSKNCKFNPTTMITYAARCCSVRFLEFLKSLNKFKFSKKAPTAAAKALNFSALKWLIENDCPWDSKQCYKAVEHVSWIIREWIVQKVGTKKLFSKKKDEDFDEKQEDDYLYEDFDVEAEEEAAEEIGVVEKVEEEVSLRKSKRKKRISRSTDFYYDDNTIKEVVDGDADEVGDEEDD